MTRTAPKSITLAGPFDMMFLAQAYVSMFDGGQDIVRLNISPEASETFPLRVGDRVRFIRNSLGQESTLMLGHLFGKRLDKLVPELGKLGATIVFTRGKVVMRALITPVEGEPGKIEFHAAHVVPESELYSGIQPLPLTKD